MGLGKILGKYREKLQQLAQSGKYNVTRSNTYDASFPIKEMKQYAGELLERGMREAVKELSNTEGIDSKELYLKAKQIKAGLNAHAKGGVSYNPYKNKIEINTDVMVKLTSAKKYAENTDDINKIRKLNEIEEKMVNKVKKIYKNILLQLYGIRERNSHSLYSLNEGGEVHSGSISYDSQIFSSRESPTSPTHDIVNEEKIEKKVNKCAEGLSYKGVTQENVNRYFENLLQKNDEFTKKVDVRNKTIEKGIQNIIGNNNFINPDEDEKQVYEAWNAIESTTGKKSKDSDGNMMSVLLLTLFGSTLLLGLLNRSIYVNTTGMVINVTFSKSFLLYFLWFLSGILIGGLVILSKQKIGQEKKF